MKKAMVSLVFLGLVGCGGGGSSSSNDGGLNQPEPSDNLDTSFDENIEKISGLYNSSVEGDESYLYINPNGSVVSYDFQGDANGSGSNCYIVATTGTNSDLNGGTVSYSAGTYTFQGGGDGSIAPLTFTYSDTEGLSNFSISGISAGTGLNFGNIRLGGENGRLAITSPSISDITTSICP